MFLRQLIIVTTFLLITSSFGLGIFSLVRNPKSKTVISWFLASMTVTIWSIGYILTITSKTEEIALINLKMVYFGASLIPILTFHFIVRFLHQEKKFKYLTYTGYLAGAAFLYLSIFTNYIFSGVKHLDYFGKYEEIQAVGFYPFLVYFLFFSLFSVILLIISFLKNDGLVKRQSFFLALALVIGFAGGISNFITDLTGIYPYGQMVVWLYPVIVTYGIFIDEFKFKLKF